MPLYPVKSAARVIEILELYQREKRALTVVEVSRRLGWPAPSTLAILKTLVGSGYLIFDNREKHYFPSPRIAHLAEWVTGAFFDKSPVIDIAQRLAAETPAGVIISVLNDLHVQYLHVIPGRDNATYGGTVGGLRLAVDSSAGLRFLGELPESAVDRICRRINIKYRTKLDRIEPRAITRLTRSFQQQGYGVLVGKPQPDIMAISMLLPVTFSGRRFAVSVAGQQRTILHHRDKILNRMSDLILNAA
jgi:DNA-binding IclR family transcriptional regulator